MLVGGVIGAEEDGADERVNVNDGTGGGVTGGEWKTFLYANRTCFMWRTGIVEVIFRSEGWVIAAK